MAYRNSLQIMTQVLEDTKYEEPPAGATVDATNYQVYDDAILRYNRRK